MNQLTATIIITGLTLLAASAVWSNGGESSKKEHNHAALEAHRVGFDRVFGETHKNSKWSRSNMNQLTATIITGLTLLAASAVWSNGGESSKKEHNHAALEAGQDQGHKSSAIEAISKN